jgi:nitrogen fixation NifU-like protein
MYTPTVMEHFMKPQNVGEIEQPDGVGEVGNAACGDIMRISLKIKDGLIEDIKFKTFGCAAAIATSSMITQLAKGKSLEEARNISNKDVASALNGLPPVKMHCSNLAATALKAAITDFEKHQTNITSPERTGSNGEGAVNENGCKFEEGHGCGV